MVNFHLGYKQSVWRYIQAIVKLLSLRQFRRIVICLRRRRRKPDRCVNRIGQLFPSVMFWAVHAGNYYSATSNNIKSVYTGLRSGWAFTFGTARRGLGGAEPTQSPPRCTNVTAHPSTASVPITVLYIGLLLRCFNIPRVKSIVGIICLRHK